MTDDFVEEANKVDFKLKRVLKISKLWTDAMERWGSRADSGGSVKVKCISLSCGHKGE